MPPAITTTTPTASTVRPAPAGGASGRIRGAGARGTGRGVPPRSGFDRSGFDRSGFERPGFERVAGVRSPIGEIPPTSRGGADGGVVAL
jgi:hypothetical protein